jgi:hypothetical protein
MTSLDGLSMASVNYPAGKADKNWALPRKATQKHATQTDSFEKSPPPSLIPQIKRRETLGYGV